MEIWFCSCSTVNGRIWDVSIHFMFLSRNMAWLCFLSPWNYRVQQLDVWLPSGLLFRLMGQILSSCLNLPFSINFHEQLHNFLVPLMWRFLEMNLCKDIKFLFIRFSMIRWWLCCCYYTVVGPNQFHEIWTSFILFCRNEAHKKNPLGPSLHVTVQLCKLVLDFVVVSLSINFILKLSIVYCRGSYSTPAWCTEIQRSTPSRLWNRGHVPGSVHYKVAYLCHLDRLCNDMVACLFNASDI